MSTLLSMDWTNHFVQEPSHLYWLITCVTIAFFALCSYVAGNGMAPGFEGVGMSNHSFSLLPAKFRFLRGGREMVHKAMQRLQRPFHICALEGTFLVLPSKYIEEVKNRKAMSFNGAFQRGFFSFFPGFEGNRVTLDSDVLKTTVRTKLTQSLGPVSIDLCDQADKSVEKIYGQPLAWTEFNTREHAHNLVAILSTRVFLGERLIQNSEWIRVAVDYTTNMMLAVRSLQLLPAFLRPILHWVVPHCILLRRTSRTGRRIIAEEMRLRANEQSRSEQKPSGTKTSDSIGWMLEIAGTRQIDLAGAQLSLTFAAVHTTSDILTKTMYYVAADSKVADAIRQEVIKVLSEEGWKKTALTKMRFLDSLMKEVQRLHPLSVLSLPRYTEEQVVFKDGTVIPQGHLCAVLADGMRDPNVYENPDDFDAWRFVKKADSTGNRNHWQFVTTSPEHYGFGHGIHACPGRFFAANELKICLIFLVLKYDWRVVDLDKRIQAGKEPVLSIGADLILHPRIKLNFKARTPEIDIAKCGPGPD